MYTLYRISLVIRFMFDREIPLREKWWAILPAVYMLSPIDLIPEPILIFGFIDDIVVLVFLLAVGNDKIKKYYDIKDKKEFKNKRFK